MATSPIPENIRKLRPEPCSMVKRIGGNYYVYRYKSKKLASGSWGIEMGSCIGKIVEGEGFIPNSNCTGDRGQGFTTFEYGQYAFLEAVSSQVFLGLKDAFPIKMAAQIYVYSLILYANEFVHMDQVGLYYEQSWLSMKYKKYSFSLGEYALGSLLDGLGRKRTCVEKFENALASDRKVKAVAIDGHVMGSCSDGNDLAEPGYKASELKTDQVNVLVAYDVEEEKPLCTKVFRGSSVDKRSIQDFMEDKPFRGVLFIVDRGFHSKTNLKLLSENGNTYIIPELSSSNEFKEAMADRDFKKDFFYGRGKTVSQIMYKEVALADRERIIVAKDMAENQKTAFHYRRCIEMEKRGYTEEEYTRLRSLWGIVVLRTNSTLSAEKVYKSYMKRWKIETYYNFVKNHAGFRGLKLEDYYKEQGFSFIMLIVGLIHHEMMKAVRKTGKTTFSTYDAILSARRLKVSKHGKTWRIDNQSTKDNAIFKTMGFIPSIEQPSL